MTDEDAKRVVVIGDEARVMDTIGGPRMGKSLQVAAALAAASAAGMTVIRVDRGGRDITSRHQDEVRHLDDRLDALAYALGPHRAPPRSRLVRQMFDGLRGAVTHIDTPKPIRKRKARRLRGKGRA